MALRPNRSVLETDISYFMNETASRGGIVVLSTVGSGAAMDQAAALVTYAASASGKMPVGVLMCDMVNLDLTRQHINWHKDEVQQGGKVWLMTKGDVETNMIYPGKTPAVGNRAYVHHSGYITSDDEGAAHTPIVGYFKSAKDEDGFAKVAVNLPQSRS
jgi:hypothetical protein